MIEFLPVDVQDYDELVRTSILAFHNDVTFGAPGPGGPPGYVSVETHRKFHEWGVHLYKIVDDDEVIGGIITYREPNDPADSWTLGRVWLVPDKQGQGIGARAVRFAESTAPQATRWKRDTPEWNRRTQHFYKKLGYDKVGLENGLVLFEKRM